MQMHRLCIPLILSGLCRTALAQEPLLLTKEVARDKAFLPVYTRYLDAINTRGMEGIKTLTAPDFTMKYYKETRTGDKALAELKKYIVVEPEKGEAHITAVKLRRLTFVGERAIAETEETGVFHFGDSPKEKMTATWLWKQTWRRTPQGWRLLFWEKGTDKLPPAPVTLSYTITWPPKDPRTTPDPPSPAGKE